MEKTIETSWPARSEFNREQKKEFDTRINGERKDEKIAADAIVEYCQLHGLNLSEIRTECEIEGTKPDRILFVNGQQIILEIRQSGSGFTLEDNDCKERCEKEKSIMSNSNLLQQAIARWVKPGQTIILMICHPLKKSGKGFLNKLDKKLECAFSNDVETYRKVIQIDDEEVFAKSTIYYKNMPEYSPLKLVYGPGLFSKNPSFENDLIMQAVYVLTVCISEKEKKYKNVSVPKWLAILNVHQLLKIENYIEAYQYLLAEGMSHCFEKIFVIAEGKAYFLS